VSSGYGPLSRACCCYRDTVTSSSLVGRGDHDDWSPIFVFWGRLQLISREIERDAVVVRGRKVVERVPIDRDLAVTDPQEAPKVDDGSITLVHAAGSSAYAGVALSRSNGRSVGQAVI
jgi:hypothetical protein